MNQISLFLPYITVIEAQVSRQEKNIRKIEAAITDCLRKENRVF